MMRQRNSKDHCRQSPATCNLLIQSALHDKRMAVFIAAAQREITMTALGSDLSFAAICADAAFPHLEDTALANYGRDCFGKRQMQTIRFEPCFIAEMRYETWYEALPA